MRLIDRVLRRYGDTFYEGEASGAAVLTTTYGSADNEAILPNLAAFGRQSYSGNCIVFGAILARIMLGSEITFKFENLNTKKLFGNNDADGLRILEHPWPNGTTGELVARAIQDIDLAGNFYLVKGADQLIRLRPDQVTIVSKTSTDSATGNHYREVVGYTFDPTVPPNSPTPSPDAEYYDVSEVAHWSPIPDPNATFKGMSWLTPVIAEIQADNLMTGYKMKYLTNAATPNILLKYKQKLQSETIDMLRERIRARHGGMDNAFETLVLDQGADLMVVGNSFEQMAFATVQAAGGEQMLVASGVPGVVVGSKEGLAAATYSNYQQAMRRFADITMRPLWRSLCACLQKLITVPGPSRLWFDTSDIAALRQDEMEAAQTMGAQAQAIGELVRYGYDPDSVRDAVMANDLSRLTHPGIPISITTDVPKAAPAPVVLGAPGQPAPLVDPNPPTGAMAKPAFSGGATNGSGH